MAEYGDAFFAAMGKENYSASQIIKALYDYVRPRSVLDAGCGTGSWLSAFAKAGVAEIRGLDGDYINRAHLAIDPAYFTPTDLTKGFDLRRRYDLTICMEVAEHLPFDQLRLRRLKKRKLLLKDQISKIESELLPDIIA